MPSSPVPTPRSTSATATTASPPPSALSAPPVVVVVMRHGERHDAVHGIDEGDTALTPGGIVAVADAAKRLGHILQRDEKRTPPAVVGSPVLVASPFRRTLQTAAALDGAWDDHVAAAEGTDSPSPASAPASPDGPTRRRVRIDPAIGEVYGPQRIKVALPPILDAWQDVLPDAIVPDGGIRDGLEPAEWGEDAPAAHARLTRAFHRHVAEQHAAGGGLRVLVTHGDALQAIVAAVRPGRVVYDCAYLGFAVLRQRRPGGPWRVVALDGIMAFDECEADSPASEPDAPQPKIQPPRSISPAQSLTRTQGHVAIPIGTVTRDDGGGGGSDALYDPPATAPTTILRGVVVPPPNGAKASPRNGDAAVHHTAVVVEVFDDDATPVRPVLDDEREGRAHAPRDASPYGGGADSDLLQDQYSAVRPTDAASASPDALAKTGPRRRSSAPDGVDDGLEEEEVLDADCHARYQAPLAASVALLAAPQACTALSFAALSPQRTLPATLMITTVIVSVIAATVVTVVIRRQRAARVEMLPLVGTKREKFTDAVARLASTRRQGILATCWVALSLTLCAASVGLTGLIAPAIDRGVNASELVSSGLWSHGAWISQWVLLVLLDALVALLTPL